MKKILRVFATLMVVITTIVFLFPENIFAIKQPCDFSGKQNNDSNVVLAYYDVATGKETLYTAEDLKSKLSSNLDKVGSSVKTKPQKATMKVSQKKLSNKQQKVLEEAEKNTLEYNKTMQNPNEIDSKRMESDNSVSTLSTDNRTLVTDVNSQPYYSIAKLCYTKATSQNSETTSDYVGTGFAVGYNLCATARHCITDNYGNWVTNFKAYYGYNGEADTYSNLLTNVTGYVYYPQYIKGYNEDGTIQTDWEYDIAFVVWGNRTVEQTGCFGMSSDISVGTAIQTAGYPADLRNGLRMYKDSGMVSSLTDRKIWYSNITTFGGQSGSPVYDTNLYVYGVHTHREPSGRRIDGALIQWLIDAGYV